MRRRLQAAWIVGLSLCCTLSAAADGMGAFNDGETVYKKVCGYCHDVGVGPVIKGRQLPSAVTMHIARSGSRAMPAFKPTFLDDATLQAVADYIQQSPAPAPAPATRNVPASDASVPSADSGQGSSETQVASRF